MYAARPAENPGSRPTPDLGVVPFRADLDIPGHTVGNNRNNTTTNNAEMPLISPLRDRAYTLSDPTVVYCWVLCHIKSAPGNMHGI